MVGVGALLSLTKHEGTGNDFLVLLDPEGRHPLDARSVQALCDRRRGVGADGLVRGLAGDHGAHLAMDLRNADGSPAEVSGNGLACLAQAAVAAGLSPPDLVVDTRAGRRAVQVRPGPHPVVSTVSMGMGWPEVGERQEWPLEDGAPVSFSGWRVSVGNPHLVLACEGPDTLAGLDVARLGAAYQRLFPDGVNVEWATPVGPDGAGLALRVYERGAGETLSCGTGSVAAAAAFSRSGRVADLVRVANPGGELVVDLSGPEAVLTAPVRRVARVEVFEAALQP
jgi:diaminopimelate epimerase